MKVQNLKAESWSHSTMANVSNRNVTTIVRSLYIPFLKTSLRVSCWHATVGCDTPSGTFRLPCWSVNHRRHSGFASSLGASRWMWPSLNLAYRDMKAFLNSVESRELCKETLRRTGVADIAILLDLIVSPHKSTGVQIRFGRSPRFSSDVR